MTTQNTENQNSRMLELFEKINATEFDNGDKNFPDHCLSDRIRIDLALMDMTVNSLLHIIDISDQIPEEWTTASQLSHQHVSAISKLWDKLSADIRKREALFSDVWAIAIEAKNKRDQTT